MRILTVTATAGVGGGETQLLLLADRLGGEFDLSFAVPEEGRFAAALRERGHPVSIVPLASRASLRTLRTLRRLMRQQAPDIVHTHNLRANVYGRLAARWAGVPAVVSTVHNSIYDYPIHPATRAAYRVAERWTARGAARVVGVSHAIAADLVDRYGLPARQVLVIPNGTDVAALAPRRPAAAVRAELGLGPTDRAIGFVGRLTPQKGVGDLLEAVARLRPAWPGLRCVVVGDGPLRPGLEARAARLGIAGACRFLGVRADVADLFPALEAWVLPSLSEGLPMVLLEALAAGRPVVAAAVDGIAEVVTDRVHGLLVPPRDPAALAAALDEVLGKPSWAASLAEAGRARVLTDFTADAMAARYRELYVRLARPRTTAGRC
jgi:glycosyltransferase involved in cell wall biosynthesis